VSREHICQYGNCAETRTPISVNTGDERPRFCGFKHLALWAIGRALRVQYDPDKRAEFLLQIEQEAKRR
jgi:hypothetical protein